MKKYFVVIFSIIVWATLILMKDCKPNLEKVFNTERSSTSDEDREIQNIMQQIEGKPDDPKLYFQLGCALRRKAFHNKDDEAFNQFTNLNDALNSGDYNSASDALDRGEAALERTRGKYLPAVEAFKNAIYYDPQYYEAYIELGLTYRLCGNIKAAEETYQKAYIIRPNEPPESRD